ncbi:hypothetical protein BRARA_B01736 [Brassica rapa]|uniref:Acidic protein n=2 Tax=Brassica TaxID=3705 RepID=A0A398AA23_BRACM|nr:hypothetical protein BRARA_B01736 [Brassica rapa]CAF2138720.1 unnamed protein product [Brassica napus]CDY12662.1 BnaA02g13300D [Brassica napus]
MEVKTVILSVLISSLVMAQIQVEAKTCCPTTTARRIFDSCYGPSVPLTFCARISGCHLFPQSTTCPPEFPANRLENSADVVNEYCKLRCTSSVCGPLTTLQNSGASEIGDGAVEDCAKACSGFCTNGSTKLAVETA